MLGPVGRGAAVADHQRLGAVASVVVLRRGRGSGETEEQRPGQHRDGDTCVHGRTRYPQRRPGDNETVNAVYGMRTAALAPARSEARG